VARAYGPGMDDVADVAQIFGKIRRALRFRRNRIRGRRCRWLDRRLRPAEQTHQARFLRGWSGSRRRGVFFRRWRRTRDLGMLDVEPLVALRRLAAEAAR